MGIDITYFGEGTYFGSGTKFGYGYSDDTFDTDSVADIKEILLEAGDMYDVIQETDTTDTLGDVTAVSNSTFRAYGLLQDISKKDRKIIDMGLAIAGNIKGFFKPTYLSGGVTYQIEEGNILTDKSNSKWRVVKIIGERTISDTEIFKVLILKNINMEGS